MAVSSSCSASIFETASREKKERIEKQVAWLGRFFGGVNRWQQDLSDDTIERRVKSLANAEHFEAIVLPETAIIRERAETRNRAERPPGHKKHSGLNDCKIWEQCLELLKKYDVVFVSGDSDFCSERRCRELHPQLQAEAKEVGAGRSLTFHHDMEALLSELRTDERPAIPKETVFAFVYDELADQIKEWESNTGCRPTKTGEAKQTFFTTDQASVLEVRLEVDDQWKSPDGTTVSDFFLRGSCYYNMANERLYDFTGQRVKLKRQGWSYVEEGSYINLGLQFGSAMIKPDPIRLE